MISHIGCRHASRGGSDKLAKCDLFLAITLEPVWEVAGGQMRSPDARTQNRVISQDINECPRTPQMGGRPADGSGNFSNRL